MALIIKDRVKEITTTTGTGAVSLGGASATFDAFQSVMSNGDTTFYAIVHTTSGVDQWEVGIGTWNTDNTLTRNTIISGSSNTSAVNFSSGTKDIFMTYPASKTAVAGEDVTFADVTATDITSTGTVTLSADPSSALQAATKQYVDTIAAAGIHYHTPVRVEHPSNLNATYNNGSSGVGATLTNAGTNAALVLDNVSMVLNDRVLVANQTDQTQNGIYTVTTVGDGSTAWVLTRSTDTDTAGPSDPDAFGKGDAFFIKEGDTNAGHLDVLTTTGTIVFGTTNIVFSEVAETSIYAAGAGLSLTGTTFAVDLSYLDNRYFTESEADSRFVNVSGDTMSGQLAIIDNDGGQPMLQVRNHSTTNTGAFTDSYTAEIRGSTSGSQTHGMLINLKEANDSRRTLDIGDLNGIFASFVNGKVGIGISSGLTYPLTIKEDTNNSYIHFVNSTTGTAFSDGTQIGVPSGSTDLIINNRENANTKFYTANTERMRIDSIGDLTVKGGRIFVNESDNGNTAIGLTRDADEGYVQVYSAGSITTSIRGNGDSYFNGGNIGIGTSSPDSSAKLHTQTANSTARTITESTNASGYVGYRATNGTGYWEMQIDGANQGLRWLDDGTERMRIDSSGDVIIGDTTVHGGGIGASNKYLQVHGPSGAAGVLNLGRDTNTDNQSLGEVRFYNANNADDNNNDADGKMVAVVQARAETSDSNAGDDSGAHLIFSTKPEAGTLAERMRIDSSGGVHVGGTSESGTGQVSLNPSGYIKARKNNVSGIFDRITTDGDIVQFRKDGTTVGSISTYFGNPMFGKAGGARLAFDTSIIYGSNDSGTTENGTIDIGGSSARFKDLHLSGSAYTPVVQGFGDEAGLTFGGALIAPRKNNAAADGTVDLGASSARFKDLHLSGAVNSGDIHIKSGTSGTNTQGLLFTLTDNADAQAYIKKTSYYMHYNAHQNEGHRFTVHGGDDLLRMHGANNGTRPDSIDILAANGLYMGNTQVMTLGRALTNITGATINGNLTLEDGQLYVGNVSADNWTRVRHIETDGYGFDWQHSNATVIVNEQGGTNQVLVLGDVDGNGDYTGLFGVAHSTDTGSNWTKKLDLRGNGELYIGSSGTSKVFHEGNTGTFLYKNGDITSNDWNDFINGTEASWRTVLAMSGSNNPGNYTYGLALSFSESAKSKFQLYASEQASDQGTSGGLMYRTGWNAQYRAWRKIWDSGNDGSGSGLDADLLDGTQGANVIRSGGTITVNDLDGSGYPRITASGGSAQLGLFRSGSGTTGGMYIGADGSRWRVYNTSFSERFGVDSGGNSYSNSSSRAPIFYDSNDAAYYVDPASTSNLNKWMSGSANGNSTAPRYDTSAYVLQSQHWYGHNSGQGMYVGESGNDVYVRGQMAIGGTAIESGYALTMTGDIDMNNSAINYLTQVHFQDNVRFVDEGNDQYLRYKAGDTGGFGMKFYNGSDQLHGYVYGDGAGSNFGLLANDGSWAIQCRTDKSSIYHRLDTPIMYDQDDTAYYVNPNSDSRMARLNIGDTSNYIIIGDESAGFNTSYAQIRTTNTGALRIDSKQGQDLYLNWYNTSATHVISESPFRSPVYYDRNDTAYYTNPANNSVMNQISLGTPGNGSNTKGRFISLEGNTDSSGEGSGRIFFSEHNNTTSSMDAYGMSMGYRGGGTSITGVSGNAWTGLSQISNGQWGMWGHDANATGALIMYGDRGATFVNFAGNDIQNVGTLTANTIRAGDGNDGYFFSDTNGRTAFEGGDFYIKSNVGNTYLYATNTYLGASSGNNIYVRGNTISGDSWSITGAGTSNLVRTDTQELNVNGGNRNNTNDATVYITATNNNDWGLIVNKYNSSASEYGVDIRMGSSFNYGLRVLSAGSTKFIVDTNKAQHNSSVRAPIFYDSNNTSYYFDGAATGDSIRCAGDIVAYYSDERLKDIEGNIDTPLEKVSKLNGFYYVANKKARELGYKADRQVGVSAQEVEAVMPEIVKDAAIGHGYKTVDYAKLVPLLIEAVKEQQKLIEALYKKFEEID